MFKWDSVFEWGRRASDRQGAGARHSGARPAARERHRARADRGSLPAADRAEQRPHRRRRGAGALGDRAFGRRRCSRAPPPPGSTSACRGWSSARRCAAPRCGKARSRASSCRSTCCPRTFRATAMTQWLLDEIAAAGMDPTRVTVEITESALLVDQPAVAERLARLRDAGHHHRHRRFRHRLCEPRLSDDAAARHDQDRPRADRRHRRRRARPDRGQGDDPAGPRARPAGRRRRRREHRASWRLLAEWGCDLYQGFLGAGALTQEELCALRRRGAGRSGLRPSARTLFRSSVDNPRNR